MLTLLKPVIQLLSFTPRSESCPGQEQWMCQGAELQSQNSALGSSHCCLCCPLCRALRDPLPLEFGSQDERQVSGESSEWNNSAGSSSHRSGKRRCSGTLRLLRSNLLISRSDEHPCGVSTVEGALTTAFTSNGVCILQLSSPVTSGSSRALRDPPLCCVEISDAVLELLRHTHTYTHPE